MSMSSPSSKLTVSRTRSSVPLKESGIHGSAACYNADAESRVRCGGMELLAVKGEPAVIDVMHGSMQCRRRTGIAR
eukprot:1585967-Amphidinium_carterae.2